MKLEAIKISKFRSVLQEIVTSCGDFNVLIGKNNSGKSNILSALHTFFTCIANGEIVNLNPPIGSEIHFYERDISSPIIISLLFQLSIDEIDSLVEDLTSDAPQMKHGVSGITSDLRLMVSIFITPEPHNYSYISEIALVDKDYFENNDVSSKRTILNVGNDAANEIFLKFQKNRKTEDTVNFLRDIWLNFNEDEWRRFRDERLPRDVQYYMATRRMRILTDINTHAILEPLLADTETFSDFKESVQSLGSQLKNEIAASQNEPLSHKINTFAGEDSQVPSHVLRILEKLSRMKVLYLVERRKRIGTEEANRLLALKIQRGGTEKLQNIQAAVSALLGVQIDAFQGKNPPNHRSEMAAEMDVDKFLVEVNGSGIKEALRLLLDVEFEKPNILLVEEPELHLHPGLETNMMLFLKRISLDHQVFITTHSTNFLDTAEMTNVYLVSKDRSTHVKHLTESEAELFIPRELGIRLSSLFMFDSLVFVEGQSDEDAIREWANTLGINLSKSNVGFINMGGVRNFAHFAAEKIVSFLTKRQVKLFFIIDRDERDSQEIAQLENILQGKAKLFTLARRELENYMLDPNAILKFIALKCELIGDWSLAKMR